MDIKKIAISQEGVRFKPKFVDGSTLDIEFVVVGRNSDKYLAIQKKYSKQVFADRKKAADKIDEMTVDVLCACVIDWKNLQMDGEDYPCNYENKKAIFGNPEYKWLIESIDEFVADDSNFLSNAQRSMS